MTIVWLIDGLRDGSWWQRDHLLLIPLFALVLFALVQSISSAISADPFESRRFSLRLLAISLTLGLLLRYTSNPWRVRFLIFLIIGVAVGSALFGLLKNELLHAGFGSVRERLSASGSYAQFDNRNHFAFLMEAAMGLLLGVAVAERRHLKRLGVYLLAGAIMWAALLLTHSRGAVLSLITEVTVFFLLLISIRLSSRRANKSNNNTIGLRWRMSQLIVGLAVGSLVISIVGATVAFVGGEETVRKFESTPSEFVHEQSRPMKVLRPQIWGATLGMIKDNPVLGTGLGAVSTAIPRYVKGSGDWSPEQAHNDYLELLASGGLIGTLLMLWFVLLVVKRARKCIRQASGYELTIRCGVLAGLCGIAIHSMFDFGLHVTVNSLVCVALVVLAVKAFNTRLTPGSVVT